MTRAEILDCLTDRPCDSCKFHESGKCERWDCVFEEKPDDAEDCEDKRMTREEAIRALRYERKTALHENKCAFDMAIKALSAEPCEDAISRQAALTRIKMLYPDMPIVDVMGSRQRWIEKYAPYFECETSIKVLPSVTPKQKPGKWIYTKAVSTGEIIWSECSVCGEGEHGCAKRMKFCPMCGAKMEESEGESAYD